MKKISFLFFILCHIFFYSQTPVLNPIVGPSSVCAYPSSSSVFSVTATNSPSTFSWSVIPMASITIMNPQLIKIDFNPSTQIYTIMCSASNSQGPSAIESKTVVAFDTPTFSLIGSNQLCKKLPSTSAQINIVVANSNWGFSPQYTWSPSNVLLTSSSNNVVANLTTTTVFTVNINMGPCSYSNLLTMYLNDCTGIKNNQDEMKANFELLFNSSSQELKVKNLQQKSYVRIIDMYGNLMFSNIAENSVLEVNTLSFKAGYYLIEIKSRDGNGILKFIKD